MGRIRIHMFGCPTNWPLKCLWDFNTESGLDDKLWNCIATLPGCTLFYITKKWNLTMNEYSNKIIKYSRNASGNTNGDTTTIIFFNDNITQNLKQWLIARTLKYGLVHDINHNNLEDRSKCLT